MKFPTAIIAGSAILSGCASSGPESNLGKQEDRPRRIEMSRTSDCTFQSTIQDYQVIDDRYVVLFDLGRRKAYLAQIAGGCFDVESQHSLAVIDGDRNGRICGFGRDDIAYERLGRVERCRILGMEQLSDERRVELGLGAPPAPKPRKDEEKEEEKAD